MGLATVPVTKLGDRYVVGYRPRELEQLLGLRHTELPTIDVAEIAKTMGVFLEATRKYLLEIPDEALPFKSADPGHRVAGMDLRVFAYHIFRIVDLSIEASHTGSLRQGLDDLWIVEAADIRSFAEIIANGQRSIQGLREWAQSNPAWDKPVDGGELGPLTLEGLFRQILSHSGHHLRQLVVLMEELGIAIPEAVPNEMARVDMPADMWA